MTSRDVQLETMHFYRALAKEHSNWGGKLALLIGAECVHSGAASAVSITGGASLALDSNAATIKAAQRAGYLDFVVNSLDEALRALKNEVRQKRALSVGLIANERATLAEMDERGIVPDARLDSRADEQGALNSEEHNFSAQTAPVLRALDTALLAVLPADDLIRRRWIERAPQFLREARSGGRWIWLNETELAALAEQGIRPSPLP